MRKALVVGIDSYAANPLRGCRNDATRVAEHLMSSNCQFEVRILLDSEASRSRIKRELSWLFSDTDDSVLYFAGHGIRTPLGTYLVTHDGVPDDEGVDLQTLAAAANRLAATVKSVIFILDCCHSGDATPRGGSHPDPLAPNDLPNIPGKGRILLAACRGEESALEVSFAGVSHGAFTHHLCIGLSGHAANDNGEVSLNALHDYVVGQLRAGGQQTPVMKGDQEGTVLLARNVKRLGTWTRPNATRLTPDEAASKAEALLSSAHQTILLAGSSHKYWLEKGHADSCRQFDPVLQWFRRRIDAQPELRSDPQFSPHYTNALQMFSTLCGLKEGAALVNGTIGSAIGSGSFGTVWHISGGAWKEPVCFKSFHPNDLSNDDKVGRFRRGFSAMKQLDHPNIVKVLQLDELPFGFFMQYVDGPNLRKLSPGSSFEPEQILDILLGVAETLKHAHGRGVLHRDVKPENILVKIDMDGRPEPFLTDFDLAWFSSATRLASEAAFGSQFYAPPEQINVPRASLTHQPTVDVYSFGQLCFFAVSGRDPMAFDPEGNSKVLSRELGQKWLDADASAEMLALYRDCVKLRTSERIQDIRLVCDRLASILLKLQSPQDDYDSRKLLHQLKFNLGMDISSAPMKGMEDTMRSRSGRTELTLSIVKENDEHCALDVSMRPNDLILEGRKSSDTRLVINQRIDAMLREYASDHSTERKGAKSGAFEITIRMDRIPKSRVGVLRGREIISRVVDILEQS